MQVRNQFDKAVFGEQRQWSGVSGYPIKNLGLDFIRRLQNINAKQKLDLSIIGVGGITIAEDFTHYHNAGADIAMSATGTMWNPYLGVEYHNLTSNKADK